jgi:hypothetical protein
MKEKIKSSLDCLNYYADLSKNIAFVGLSLWAISFYIWPSSRRFIRSTILNESVYIFAGDMRIKDKELGDFDEKRTEFVPQTADEKEYKFFTFYRIGLKQDDTGAITKGQMLLIKKPIVAGRDSDTINSHGPGLKSLLKLNECFYVTETIPPKEIKGHNDYQHIWVHGLREDCSKI